MVTQKPNGQSLGPAVDRAGAPVIDPTENVKALSEAAQKRSDDLLESAVKRQDDLRDAHEKMIEKQLEHQTSIGSLRAEHAKELNEAESKRIDAIRLVDVNAVRVEADRALQAIQALAATTAINAETLRNALVNTAATIAKQTADTVGEITTRIAALEKASYEGAGKQTVSDPAQTALAAEVRMLRQAGATSEGKSTGTSTIVAYVISGLFFLLGLAGFVVTVIKFASGK